MDTVPNSPGRPRQTAPGYEFFYGLEPRWVNSDRLYKIYVTEVAFCGARVAGQCYDRSSALLQLCVPLGPFFWLTLPIANWLVRRREVAERQYAELDPVSQRFFAMDAANFCLDAGSIRRATLRPKAHWWTQPLPNSGTLELESWEGATRRFILVGKQDWRRVRDLVARLVLQVEVVE